MRFRGSSDDDNDGERSFAPQFFILHYQKNDKNVASLEKNVATNEVEINLQEVIQEIMGVLKDRERSLELLCIRIAAVPIIHDS